MRPFIKIMKLRMTLMCVVATVVGYVLALGGSHLDAGPVLALILASALAAAGSFVLNQYLERDPDARMNRTRGRPIPSGEIAPLEAIVFGMALTLWGVFLTLWQFGPLAAFLILLISFLYVVVYTPLKRITWWNTTVGAIPGALPPLVGWAAARGELDLGAWVLFAVMFAWQHPHFFAISWMYRDDYRRGGFEMLSVVGQPVAFGRWLVFFSVLLLVSSLVPVFLGFHGHLYLVGALVLGAYLMFRSLQLVRTLSFQDARSLLRGSLVYLPVMLTLMVVD